MSLKIIRGGRLPQGADLADFLAWDWTTEEVTAWAKPLAKIYDPKNIPAIINEEKPSSPETASPETKEEDLINLTDLGNAKCLVGKHGADIRFCHLWRKWFVWDGRRWLKDDTGEAERRAKNTILSFHRGADELEHEVRERLIKHALKSESSQHLSAMLSLAESEEGISISPEQLDKDPWLLNCENGTIDLRTGELRPHRREDFISKLAPVSYDPNATCPLWDSFLLKIMNDNVNLIEFLQRAIGHSLTAVTREQVIFILYGGGSNGKTTFLEALRDCFGDYAQQMPASALMVKKGDGIPNDVARLKGARFVTASETGEGKKLSEELVKQLTGDDTISARFMRAEFFEFKPSHKLFLSTNHKPGIQGTDYAIWRRIRLVPFEYTFSEDEADKLFPVKLRAELSGILTWAVRGCLEWQKKGLGCPDEVLVATESYRKEMDALSDFIDQKCRKLAGIRVQSSVLYKVYKEWCQESGEHPLTLSRFGTQITERGIEKEQVDGRIWYLGIGLAETGEDARYGN